MQIYRVQNEETVYDIASEYGVSPVKIAEDNEIEIRGRLPRGREILVITPSRTYNARSGDTLDGIARRFKTTKESLIRQNPELCGREKLYSGQLLTLKSTAPSCGMISTNGYLYSGTTKNRLLAVMPYLSFVTLCSAIYKDGRIHNIFPSEDTVALIKSHGRAPILRVYMTELPGKDTVSDFANSIVIMAKSCGFVGATLSSLNNVSTDKERLDSLVFTTRKILMESDLLLFTEGDIEKNTSYMEYADAGILTYDKLHRADIPSFDEGEKAAFENFAYSGESSRAFVEISSFAFSLGKFIEKREAMSISTRKRAHILSDDKKKIQIHTYGRHKKREIIFESLENTKAKLGLISELGYMGVSFDIARVCIPDLMMTVNMFDLISYPIMVQRSL